MNNYSGKGFYTTSTLNIVISGTNTIEIAIPDNTNDIAAIQANGAISITKASGATSAELIIVVTGNSSATTGSEHVYGILATKGGITATDVELNITVSPTDRYAFAIEGNGKTIFTDVTGQITGGNRAIQTTGYETEFTDSTMTLMGGEKAIQAKDDDGKVTLNGTDGSNITLRLIDYPGSNTGEDDRFGLKVTTLDVGAKSTLITQGLHIKGIATQPTGKVIVSGGYEQTSKEIYNVAGLYLDDEVLFTAKVGTTTSAEDGAFTVTSDAQTYNIAVDGQSSIETIPAKETAAETATQITSKINSSAEGVKDIQIVINNPTDSNDTERTITIPDLKNKNVTLVIPADATNISNVNVTLKGEETFTVLSQTGITFTFNHKDTDNVVSISGFTGSVVVKPGSVDVTVSGNGTLTYDGNGKLHGIVTGDTTVTSTTNATVDMTGVTVSAGTLTLTGVKVSSSEYIANSGTIEFGAGTVVDGSVYINGGSVKGTVTGGNLTVKGTITVPAATTIYSDAKMSISKESTVTISGSQALTNNGTINLTGTIDNSASGSKLINNGKVIYLDKEASIKVLSSTSYEGTGSVDGSAIASDASLSGEIETVTEYGIYQTVTINANTTFVKGTQITVNGALIIADGVTLTIQDGAQLVISGPAATMENNGTIIIESDVIGTETNKKGVQFGKVGGLVLEATSNSTNNGNIILSYTPLSNDTAERGVSMTVSANLVNNGTITISDNNKMNNTVAVANKVDGTITINGEATNVKNAGTVIVNGKAGMISNVADGATVSVVKTTGNITINDTGFVYNKTTVAGDNSFAVTKEDATEVGAFTVVSEVTKTVNSEGTTVYGKKMTVSGTISETIAESATTHAAIRVGGTVNITDTLTLSEKINMTGATLDVAGTVSAKAGTQIAVNTLTVTGEVIVGSAVSSAIVNAAVYKVVVVNPASTTFYYTTLDKAIAGATEASVNEVTVTGTVPVKADVTVPAGMTVKQTNGTITVGTETNNSVTMTVASTGKITQTGGATIVVKGTLYIEDKKTGINRGAIVSCEVIAEGENDVRYTNLNSAIAAAGTEPVTITLNGNTTITSDSTIPENVTIDMNGQKFIVEGAKLTIDGTLYVDEVSNYTVKDGTGTVTKKGEVVLNGYIVSDDPISYSASNAKSPAGVYYTSGSKYMITSIDNITKAVEDSDNSAVQIYGENTVDDIAVTGTSDEPATVTVNGKLTAGKIALDFASIILKSGIKMTGTVANANGSVSFTDVKTVADTKIVSAEADSVKTLTVDSGSLDKISTEKAKTYALVMDGDVIIKSLTLANITDSDSKKVYAMTVDGNVKVITGGTNDLGDVLVNGTLVADNGVTINADTVDVLGTLIAEKATETKTAGSVAVTGDVTVGSKWADIGATATVSGNVSFNVLFVVDGSAVDESIVKDLKSTAFYVEGAVWMTAYAYNGSITTKIDVVDQVPVENAKFDGKWYADLSEVTANTLTENEKKVGEISAVYAMINYYIYNVKIIGDAGIGSVAIDGVVLAKGGSTNGENVFTGSFLKAGTHTVTYVLKDGFSGSPVLYKGGESLNGLTFTLSGIESGDTNITLNLSGTTPVGTSPSNPGSSSGNNDGMSITDYLLIVLVVLIVIMAVLVAIRMMRS